MNYFKLNFGITFLEGFYQELLKLPKVKEGLTQNWPDQHGTERDLVSRKFESRVLNLPVLLEGANTADFLIKLHAFQSFCLLGNYFDLDVPELNRRFKLCYSDCTNYSYGETNAMFTLVVIDDFPNTITPLP